MTKKLFIPYKYTNSLKLSIDKLLINGQPEPEVIDSEKKVISLYGNEYYGEINISIRSELDKSLAQLVPKNEQTNPKWKVIAKVTCDDTKFRKGYDLLKNGDYLNWSGKIKLKTYDLSGNTNIQLFLVRTDPAIDVDGEAKFRYLKIGESDIWTIQSSEPTAPLGQYLDYEWCNFSQHPKLNKYKYSVYYLDIDQSPPRLYLNLDTNQLQQLLGSPHKSGSRANLRDQIIDSIAVNVWTVLFINAADNCIDGTEPPLEWQQLVLKSISQFFYPNLDAEEQYKSMLDKIDAEKNLSRLLPSLVAELQKHDYSNIDLKNRLEKLIQSLFN